MKHLSPTWFRLVALAVMAGAPTFLACAEPRPYAVTVGGAGAGGHGGTGPSAGGAGGSMGGAGGRVISGSGGGSAASGGAGGHGGQGAMSSGAGGLAGMGNGGNGFGGVTGMAGRGSGGMGGMAGQAGTSVGGSAGAGTGGAGASGGEPVPTGGTGTGGSGGAGGSAGSGGSGTVCTNTQADPANCGTCGHSCLGGTCTAGQCQPLLLGRYDRYLGENGLSIGDSYVYAKGETNLLVRAKKDGSSLTVSPLPTFATSGCSGGGAEEINGRVFYQWYDGTTCRMAVCSTADCDGTTQGFSPADASAYVQSFAVDRTNSRVFWYDGSSKQIMTAPASATGTPTATAISGNFTADGKWTGYAAGGVLFSDAMSIDRIPASGGTYQSLLDTTGVNSGSLWATPTRLYFSDPTGTNFVTLPTASGGHQLVTATAARLLWSDDVDLYWTTVDSTTLFTCKVANCAGTTKMIYTTTCLIDAVRGESTAIYWGTYGGCSAPGTTTLDNLQIWKLAR